MRSLPAQGLQSLFLAEKDRSYSLHFKVVTLPMQWNQGWVGVPAQQVEQDDDKLSSPWVGPVGLAPSTGRGVDA